MNYTIVGAGRWGTTLAKVLGEREEVYLWGRDEGLIKRIQLDRKNDIYLPGVELPYEVRATYDLNRALNDSDVLLIAVPSHAFTEMIDACYDHLTDLEAVISGTTGFTPQNGRRLSQEYLERVESLDNFYTLVGPALPWELVEQRPSNLVLAGEEEHNRQRLSEILYRDYLRVYESDDLVGVEVTASINNLLAVVGGILEGLELNSGTRATLLTRGIHEIKRLVKYHGGNKQTVFGLSGLGTCISIGTDEASRNFRFGEALGSGASPDEARKTISGCIEAINISKIVYKQIMKGEIKAPLLTELYGLIHENLDPYGVVEKLVDLKNAPEGGRRDL